jgi:hypothetical protein
MSLRWFIYYCALVGGWAAFVGWLLGRLVYPSPLVLKAGVRGLFLGMALALGLGLLDALWNLSLRRAGEIAARVGVAFLIGCVGGFLGGLIGQALYGLVTVFFVFGWVLTGVLIGASVGAFEWFATGARGENTRGARAKFMKALLGGACGGFLGGVLAGLLGLMDGLFPEKDPNDVLSPSCWGFIALGACIGLLVGLAQVILKEAWLRVEAGFRPGREMILAKEQFTLGRAEACDLGLFGDNTIEKTHARILQQGNGYFLEDAGSSGGTYVNDALVRGRHPLRGGDLIRVGNSLIRFNERAQRKA